MFITFEGIDGSGKSTQLAAVAERLTQQGYDVVITRDPGGTALGSQLRQILLHHPDFVSDRCELFLYLADRAQHVDERIRPALAQGQVVLCDRYIDSTVAYQGGGRGLPIEEIHRMNAFAIQGMVPELTFLLDAPVPLLLSRAKSRSDADRLEQETVTFYEAVRQQYLTLAQANPDRIVVVDASQPLADIAPQILDVILSRLAQRQLSV